MKKLKDIIKERRANLPEDIRDLVEGTDIVDAVDEIAAKNSLEEWDADALIETTARLLIGDISPANFIKTIQEELDAPEDVAIRIARELNTRLLSKVKGSLLVIHSKVSRPPNVTPPSDTLRDRVKEKIPSNPATPSSKPPLASVPDYRGPSTLEQKLGSAFKVHAAVPPSPPSQTAEKKGDPYREAI